MLQSFHKSNSANLHNLNPQVCKEQFEEALSAVDARLELSFFYKLRDTRELVNGFAKSQELITWIKEIAKGLFRTSDLNPHLCSPLCHDFVTRFNKMI